VGTGGTVGGQGGAAGSLVSGGASGSSAGGTTGGTAGSAGAGGIAGGGAGGTAGSAGTGGSGGTAPTIGEIVGKLDGRLVMTPCDDNPNTDDCNSAGYITDGQLTACSGQPRRLDAVIDHPIGGTPGAMYAATMHFYGIAEPKDYGDDDKRECERMNGGQACPPQNNENGGTNLFYIGDPGETYTSSNFNTYEIHVLDDMGQEVGVYFLNSDYGEGHYSFVINYERTIPIVGGGTVRLRIYDQNCRQIKNCGATAGTPCANKAREIDISAVDPQPQMGQPPNGFTQPGLGETDEHSGQWFLLDVTAVTPR
jgi:hypothetical protein